MVDRPSGGLSCPGASPEVSKLSKCKAMGFVSQGLPGTGQQGDRAPGAANMQACC
jgi:hypothetical protein